MKINVIGKFADDTWINTLDDEIIRLSSSKRFRIIVEDIEEFDFDEEFFDSKIIPYIQESCTFIQEALSNEGEMISVADIPNLVFGASAASYCKNVESGDADFQIIASLEALE